MRPRSVQKKLFTYPGLPQKWTEQHQNKQQTECSVRPSRPLFHLLLLRNVFNSLHFGRMNQQGQRGGGDGHRGEKAKDPAWLLFCDLVGRRVNVRHNKYSPRENNRNRSHSGITQDKWISEDKKTKNKDNKDFHFSTFWRHDYKTPLKLTTFLIVEHGND